MKSDIQTPLPAKEFEECVEKVKQVNWDLQALGMTWDEIESFWSECFADAKELNKQKQLKE